MQNQLIIQKEDAKNDIKLTFSGTLNTLNVNVKCKTLKIKEMARKNYSQIDVK